MLGSRLDVPLVADLDDLVELVRIHVDSMHRGSHPCRLGDFLDDGIEHCESLALRRVSFFE